MTNLAELGKIEELSQLLKESTHTVVLTGAGMSTESGIPDFRSPLGWWKNIDPLTVATVEALEYEYDLFHEFYCSRMKALGICKPHEGHFVLAKWQEKALLQLVATQNVDGFHAEAGNVNVDELHGSIRTYRCHHCSKKATKEQFLTKESCRLCGGKLRPNVVLFGERLPEKAWENTLSNIEKAELVIVIGTSLQVYPVSQLPTMTYGKTVYINQDVSAHKLFFDLSIEASAKETLVEANKMM